MLETQKIPYALGIDVGSTTVKTVLLTEMGEVLSSSYERHFSKVRETVCTKLASLAQAIFLVDETYEEGFASVTFPYEFLPMPKIGDKGKALDRQGKPVCDAEIVGIKKTPIMDKTAVVTMKVPLEYVHAARFYRAEV